MDRVLASMKDEGVFAARAAWSDCLGEQALSADAECLDIPLPSDVVRLKEAGRLRDAARACRAALDRAEVPEVAARLRLELYRLARLGSQYCVTEEEALKQLSKECPGISYDDLERLKAAGRIDWRIIEGEVRYLPSVIDGLRAYAAEVPGLAPAVRDQAPRRALRAEMVRVGGASRRITVRASMEVTDAAPEETVRIWLPLAVDAAQQRSIEVLDVSPGASISASDAQVRTAYWEFAGPGARSITYRYRIDAPYIDLWSAEGIEAARAAYESGVAAPLPAPTEDDLAELPPHVRFSPIVDAVARHIRQQALSDDPLEVARAVYLWVTGNIDYRYQPAYLYLDGIVDYALSGLRGDCGVMALVFVTLCRRLGIPARWQSGLYSAPDDIGPHDWALFYTPSIGWAWADCSFGSSSRRMGDEERRRFFFGNLDPWRTVLCQRYQAAFDSVGPGVRIDPYDNQIGEATVGERSVDAGSYVRSVELLGMEELSWEGSAV